MNFDFLRDDLREKIFKIKNADIVAGIPSYCNEDTIENVLDKTKKGLEEFFPDLKSVIVVSDGGSTDDTREKALAFDTDRIEKIVTIYRGPAGKGSALRTIFACVALLGAKAGICLDADLRSITPEWIKKLALPIIEKKCDFIAPLYLRHKYDATITNDIAYPLTRALYGIRVRQPIGGDFGFCGELALEYLREDVWESDVARFGIDIFMTTTAICHGYRIGEAPLGAKSHAPKDPVSLTPMFRQVVGTMFELAGKYQNRWKKIRGSVTPRITGKIEFAKPDEVSFSVEKLTRSFRAGWERFAHLWEKILDSLNFRYVERVREKKELLYSATWAKIVYDYLVAYHSEIDEIDKETLL
ncbi:glycosyltransferase, partial [Candidatus Aerophobetes bacterium]|nr:glycosyltransferase [Candidatus Aerophobetes bacterium]